MFTEFSSFWWLFLFLPFLFWLGKLFFQNQQAKQKNLLFQKNQNFLPSSFFQAIKIGSSLLGIFMILLAVWRPQWGMDVQKTERKGLDLVFTVDVSKSMEALDFSQKQQLVSRLDATKYLIRSFAERRPSDRLGLVEFAGESFVASPLTLDHTIFLNFLNHISSADLGKQGTNLADALEVSLSRLEVQAPDERGKAILLFSDGEETLSGDAEKMAKMAKEKGIPIFTVGVGSEKGVPIPEGRDAFGNIVYKRWKGEIVLSKLNSDPLRRIADMTGGEYFHAEKFSDLAPLAEEIDALPKKILGEEAVSPQKEQYSWFAFLGLLLFLFGFGAPENLFSVSRKK